LKKKPCPEDRDWTGGHDVKEEERSVAFFSV